MDFDLYLVVGLVILAFAIPAVVSAFSDSRPPRISAVLVLIGGGLVALAVAKKPGGYSLEEVPQAFVRVIGTYLR